MKTDYYLITKINKDGALLLNFVVKARNTLEAIRIVADNTDNKKLKLDFAISDDYDDIGLKIQKFKKNEIKSFATKPTKLKNEYMEADIQKAKIKKDRKRKFKAGWKEYIVYEVDDIGRTVSTSEIFMSKTRKKALKYRIKKYPTGYNSLYELKKDGTPCFNKIT